MLSYDVTREGLHRIVDKVLDSDHTKLRKAMITTMEVYAYNVDLFKEQRERPGPTVAHEVEDFTSPEYLPNDPNKVDSLKVGRISNRERSIDRQTLLDLVNIGKSFAEVVKMLTDNGAFRAIKPPFNDLVTVLEDAVGVKGGMS